jgi:CRP-like cAMP-binding protein
MTSIKFAWSQDAARRKRKNTLFTRNVQQSPRDVWRCTRRPARFPNARPGTTTGIKPPLQRHIRTRLIEALECPASESVAADAVSPWSDRSLASMRPRIPKRRVSDAIGANEVLSKLRAVSKRKLAAGATFQRLEKGTVICHEGTPAVRFWLVLRGQVKLVTYSSKGAALLIDLVLSNELFGVVFHQVNPVHACMAVAMKPTELLSFCRKDLLDDLEKNPLLESMLLADTSRRLSQAVRMRGLCLEEAGVRIAQALLYLHGKFGRVIPETRATVAELAGTSVETAIRITNRLARRGVLATARGQIEILSLAGLRDGDGGGGALV